MTKAELIERIKRDGRVALSRKVIRPLSASEQKIVRDAINSVWGDQDV